MVASSFLLPCNCNKPKKIVVGKPSSTIVANITRMMLSGTNVYGFINHNSKKQEISTSIDKFFLDYYKNAPNQIRQAFSF